MIELFKRGLSKIASYPQLVYTIAVALIIFVAFVFNAYLFITIASDAQDRLININIGSIHDSFVPFAANTFEDTDLLRGVIESVAEQNETILSFRVIEYLPEGPIIKVSLDEFEEGGPLTGDTILLTLANSNPSSSVTMPLRTEEGERLYQTARVILNPENQNEAIGAVISTQTLSLADQRINRDIRNSIIILVVVLLAVMVLFVRHSRIIDYATLYDKLQEVDTLKDEFISMASHELRTPLTAIKGYVELLEETETDDEQKKYLNTISMSAERLSVLVEDMLEVSRIEQGRMSINMETLSVEDEIDAAVATLMPVANKKNLNLMIEKESVGMIEADPTRIRQIFDNIIGNAIKYTPKGDVVVRLYQENNRQFIRVVDTGIGMSEEERKHLFQKFYRIRNADTENIIGTGLGLWITKQIIEKMGGQITVESIKGVGSHFILDFPIVEDK
jgi:signal transduction histidine kinase